MTCSTASHVCQSGFCLSVGDGCEDGKRVSHGLWLIYVKYDTRRSPPCASLGRGQESSEHDNSPHHPLLVRSIYAILIRSEVLISPGSSDASICFSEPAPSTVVPSHHHYWSESMTFQPFTDTSNLSSVLMSPMSQTRQRLLFRYLKYLKSQLSQCPNLSIIFYPNYPNHGIGLCSNVLCLNIPSPGVNVPIVPLYPKTETQPPWPIMGAFHVLPAP